MRLTQYWLLRSQPRWRTLTILGRVKPSFQGCQGRKTWFTTGTRHQTPPFAESFFSARGPHGTSVNDEQEGNETDIISRAKAYNITTADQLDFESDVVHDPKRKTHIPGLRLVDRRPNTEDFYLWTILLDWRRLKYGGKGIRLIWEGLKFRCGKFQLPFTGYQGDKLWSAFVAAGCSNHKFLEEIIRYEVKKGCQRPRFFAEVVGALLGSKSPSSAKAFAPMIQVAHKPDVDELYEVFKISSTTENRASMQHFCDVYSTMPSTGLYGKVVTYLCSQGRFSDAWIMHRYLISRDDLPRSFEELKPLVLDLVNNHMRPDSLLHELTRYRISLHAQVKTFWTQERSLRLGYASENLNIVSSKTFGVQSRSISDDFAARAFLTASFSFNNILNGLRFFGLTAIGPSSIRAIGLTSSSSQELKARLAKLAELEVDTGASRFSRLVVQLVEQGREGLLQNALRSDQHADVFEDLGLQRRLLLQYYQEEDWTCVERTLAVLTLGSSGEAAQEESMNFLLRAALSAGNWTHVRNVVAEMSRHGYRFHEASIARMYNTVLSKRNPGKPPLIRQNFDDLGFLISIWLDVLRSGSMISVIRWREPIRRLGMCGRLDELEILLIQLLQWYGGGRPKMPRYADSADVIEEPAQLLSCELQSSIIAWGFIHTKQPQPALKNGPPFFAPKKSPWTRGIVFLRNVKERHGCKIDAGTVRRACLVRLRQLFNPYVGSSLRRNRQSSSRNQLPLWLYVESLERAWGEALFRDKQRLWKAVATHAPVTSRQKRRGDRRSLGNHDTTEAAAHMSFTSSSKEQETDVVFHGGPLSQAYWSSTL